MPDRRKRPDRKRPAGGVEAYEEMVALIARKTGSRAVASRWARTWLMPNKRNFRRFVPHDSPFTLITSLRILFEYPWQAMANVVSRKMGRSIRVVVAVGDEDQSQLLLVDEESSKILMEGTYDASKMRFQDLNALIAWMNGMVDSLTHLVKEKR